MVAGVVRAPGRLASGRQMHGQDMGQRGAKVLTLDDGVDQAMFERELGGLEPFGQLLADSVADNALPGEADERFGLGQDDVAVHGKRRGDAASGGIGDDRDVRQMRGGMALDGARGLRHLHERRPNPSCMRAPPEAVKMITGRCSAVARSNRRVTFPPTTLPMDPMKKVDSMMPMAHFKPAMEP